MNQKDFNDNTVEEYNSLRRALQRNKGFSLFFVQCSAETGTNIVAKIERDISQKKIATLNFDKSISSLYNEIVEIPDISRVDILFISGLEHSILAYEEYTFSDADNEDRSSSLRGVPRCVGYMNLQRDRFKRDFPFSLVFLSPPHVMNYLISRSPDFFDWRSGYFQFVSREKIENAK